MNGPYRRYTHHDRTFFQILLEYIFLDNIQRRVKMQCVYVISGFIRSDKKTRHQLDFKIGELIT